MIVKGAKSGDSGELSVEDRLRALYRLQLVDSELDKIKILRGELPLEVQDLEDEIAGIETRINNYSQEANDLEKAIKGKKAEIKESENLILRYKEQQDNVRNNREYESLNKEIEYQALEIQLAEKRIKEFKLQLASKQEVIDKAQQLLTERQQDLEHKHAELKAIVAETKEREELLESKSEGIEKHVEERLLTAYKRIRKNARNGLGVVPVERNACGGCFNKIPPQRQLDIASRRKVIVCEYCGRILVDVELSQEEQDSFNI